MNLVAASSTVRPDGSQIILFSDQQELKVTLFLDESPLDVTSWTAELVHRGVDRSAEIAAGQLTSNEVCRVEVSGCSGGQYQHPPSETFFDLSLDNVCELLSLGLAAALADVDSVINQGLS